MKCETNKNLNAFYSILITPPPQNRHAGVVLFKVTLGVSPQFFAIWTRVLNHNKYVEIKQFSKVDIKQNNISTVILLIKFLV